jgi:hypothetical protein
MWSLRFQDVTSISRSNNALSCWEKDMERTTSVEMRFAWSVGESRGNNGTFWDSLRTIFNLPALTGDCSCRDVGGQGRREEENGTVYHRARTSNNRFSLISLYYPLPFLCYPFRVKCLTFELFGRNVVQTDLFSGTPNESLQVVL